MRERAVIEKKRGVIAERAPHHSEKSISRSYRKEALVIPKRYALNLRKL